MNTHAHVKLVNMVWNTKDFLTKSSSSGARDTKETKKNTMSDAEIRKKYDRPNRKYFYGKRTGIYFYFGSSKQFVAPEAKEFIEKKFKVLAQSEDKNAADSIDLKTKHASKKRKTTAKQAKPLKKSRPSTIDDNVWRGKMQITLKSPASVAKESDKKTKIASSVSLSIGSDQDLVLMADELLQSHVLSVDERSQLESKISEFEGQPKALKLHWRDRHASVIGTFVPATKKELTLSSARNEPYSITLGSGNRIVWLGSKEGLQNLALTDIKGTKSQGLLCVLPGYKGVARVSANGTVSGGQSLKLE